MVKPITTKKKIIEFIKEFESEHGYAPEQVTIARKLMFTSQCISKHFKGMEEELSGYREYMRYYRGV